MRDSINPWPNIPRGLQRVRRSFRALVPRRDSKHQSDRTRNPPVDVPRPALPARAPVSDPVPGTPCTMLHPQRPSRRLPVHSVRDYPEHLNPFRDDPPDDIPGAAPEDAEEPELRPKQDKFGTWTVPRRRSHLIFETWSSKPSAPVQPSRPSSAGPAHNGTGEPGAPATKSAPPRPAEGPRIAAGSAATLGRPPVRPRKKRKAPPPPPAPATPSAPLASQRISCSNEGLQGGLTRIVHDPVSSPQRSSLSGAVSLPQLDQESVGPAHQLPDSSSRASLQSEDEPVRKNTPPCSPTSKELEPSASREDSPTPTAPEDSRSPSPEEKDRRTENGSSASRTSSTERVEAPSPAQSENLVGVATSSDAADDLKPEEVEVTPRPRPSSPAQPDENHRDTSALDECHSQPERSEVSRPSSPHQRAAEEPLSPSASRRTTVTIEDEAPVSTSEGGPNHQDSTPTPTPVPRERSPTAAERTSLNRSSSPDRKSPESASDPGLQCPLATQDPDDQESNSEEESRTSATRSEPEPRAVLRV